LFLVLFVVALATGSQLAVVAGIGLVIAIAEASVGFGAVARQPASGGVRRERPLRNR
jgi:hypothetical protein